MSRQIPVVRFKRNKYGEELLIDIVSLEAIRKAKGFREALRQSFYGVMLTTGGRGEVEVDGKRCAVGQGLVAFARPGDVCTVVVDEGLTSLQLIFECEFIQSFFSDPHFLDSLPYFAYRRQTPYVWLNSVQYSKIEGLFADIQYEIAHERNEHLLRAMLYEVLMLLQKASGAEGAKGASVESRVARFQALVNEHFAHETSVEFYAERLCVSAGYLNRIVRSTLGQTTKAYIQSRRIAEAKHLLRYTSLPIGIVADRLGFDTPSYFVRSFRKETGLTPLEFRNWSEK